MNIRNTILAVVVNLYLVCAPCNAFPSMITNENVGWFIDSDGICHMIDIQIDYGKEKKPDSYDVAYLFYVASRRLIIIENAEQVLFPMGNFEEQVWTELDSLIKTDGKLSADSDGMYYYITKALVFHTVSNDWVILLLISSSRIYNCKFWRFFLSNRKILRNSY